MYMTNRVKIISAVIVLILVAAAYYFGRQSAFAPKVQQSDIPVVPGISASSTEPLPEVATSTTSSSAPKPPVGATKPVSPAPVTIPSAQKGIVLLSPSADDIWAAGSPKHVEWTSATGAVGSAYLTDAITNKTLGWLIASIEPWQTRFSWDPSYVYETKTGGNAVVVPAGLYRIHLVTGSGKSEVISGIFSVVSKGLVERTTSVVRITNKKPDPVILQTPAGSIVYIVNNDRTSISLLSALFSAAQVDLSSGQALRIVTSVAEKGKFYSIFSPVLPYQDFVRIVLQ
jgi:hypothetical protein